MYFVFLQATLILAGGRSIEENEAELRKLIEKSREKKHEMMKEWKDEKEGPLQRQIEALKSKAAQMKQRAETKLAEAQALHEQSIDFQKQIRER